MPFDLFHNLLDGNGCALISDAVKNIEKALSFAFVSHSEIHTSPFEAASGVDAGKPHILSGFLGTDSADADHVWTFAYGSNMGKSKLKALGITPKATLPAVLPEHSLVFDRELGANGHLGGHNFFPPEEQAFANVQRVARPTELAPANGVAHEITSAELKVLDKSEAPIMHRELINLEVDGKNGTRILPAWTYVSKDYDSNQYSDMTNGKHSESAPSARYARLVVCGAEEQGLPKSYISKLRNHLQHLGLPHDSLDCNKPLVPLAAQGKTHMQAMASQFLMLGSGMLPQRMPARKPHLDAMVDFLFPATPLEESELDNPRMERL